MKVYTLGSHGQSNTNGKVLITIELLPNHTDMKGIMEYPGNHITRPFYRELKLNAGKVTRISDLEEEYDFTGAMIQLDGQQYNLELNKYFYLAKTDGEEVDRSEYIVAYQYKAACLEQSEYVARGYTGVNYIHYPSGAIKIKSYYKSGNVYSRSYYRDDVFNTREGVRNYRSNGQLDCEFTYDAREALIGQKWYNSKGKPYSSHTIGSSASRTTIANATAASASASTATTSTATASNASNASNASTSTTHEKHPTIPEDDEDSGSDGNLGSDAGGFRIKPRDGDEDEDDGDGDGGNEDDDDDGECSESSA